jgi:hypothetical protein
MSLQDKFKKLITSSTFEILDYIFPFSENEFSKFQQNVLEQATSILEANRVGEIQYFGGDLSKDEDSFRKVQEGLKSELNKGEYEAIRKDLEKLLEKFIDLLKELIEKTCYAIIPVKDMPWEQVLFRTVPKIKIKGKNIELLDHIISYYGEIDKIISKEIIYGKMKEEKPLFAPVMGDMELDYQKEEGEAGSKKSFNYAYINSIIESFESSSLKNHLARYHEGYERRGEPVCDYLMNNSGLMNSMNKLVSGIDSGRLKAEIAVCGIILPQKSSNSTLILVTSEGKGSNKYENCFEAVFRLSAASFDAPSAPTPSAQGGDLNQIPQQSSSQQGGNIQTPGGQNLNTWTPEELAEQRQSRQGNIPNDMEVWTPEELAEQSKSRESNLPEGMEMWNEEELKELAEKRQGGIDMPEWEPDEEMKECSNCGYSLRAEWAECPICGTPVGGEGGTDETQQKDSQSPSDEDINPE